MSGYTYADVTKTSTLAALNDAVRLSIVGHGACAFVLTGTWVGTVVLEASIDDGTTWVTATMWDLTTLSAKTSVTANGSFVCLDIIGVGDVRVRASAWTSGTATVFLRGSETAVAIARTAASITQATTLSEYTPVSGRLPVDGSGATSSSTVTVTQVGLVAGNNVIIAANSARKGLRVYNQTNVPILLKEGATASVTSFTDVLPPRASYIVDTPLYTGEVDGYVGVQCDGVVLVSERT